MESCPSIQQVVNLRFRIIPAGLYFIGKIVDRQKQFFSFSRHGNDLLFFIKK